jgi:Flp pilus assembly protein CpaB
MFPLLGIAFIVAIVSTGVFYGLFAGKLRSSSDLPGHAIVVAARDLDRGTVLQPGDLRVSEVRGVLGGAFSKPEEAAGATLLTAMKANEPLLEERVSPRLSAGAAGDPVPTGMRAVSLHVFQSESLLNLLRPGSRVDVQAVSDRNGTVELRMVLENVQVLAVSEADSNGNRPPGAVVTVLTRAADTDMLALADAGTRIRVTLRNPVDEGTTPRHSVALAALFSGGNKLEANRTTVPAAWDHPVQLHVRVLAVSDAALTELRSQLAEGTSDDPWRVAAFRSRDEAAKLIQSLKEKHQLEVVSGERLMAGVGRPISYHAGPKPYQFRVRFSLQWLDTGQLSLRVQPGLGQPGLGQPGLGQPGLGQPGLGQPGLGQPGLGQPGLGQPGLGQPGLGQPTMNASIETERQLPGASSFLPGASSFLPGASSFLPGASSFLMERQGNDPAGQEIAARLFPGRTWEHQHLVIFVSARIIQQTSPAAVARTDRGR